MPTSPNARFVAALPYLCYALLVAAWVVDLVTPQLFVAAILLNGPIALSSIALRSRLTTSLVIVAQIANVVAGYVNGVQAGYHWDGVAIGDRLLSAASFILVGYMSVKTQDFAREAGASSGRKRQTGDREAVCARRPDACRETLNVELVLRGGRPRSGRTVHASRVLLIVRDSAFEQPLVLSYDAGDSRRAIRAKSVVDGVGLAGRASSRRGRASSGWMPTTCSEG